MTSPKLERKLCRRVAAAVSLCAGLGLAGAVSGYPLSASTGASAGSSAAQKRFTAAPRTVAAPQALSRMTAPVVTVSRTAPGQAGYVHYFVITGPDGEPETQVRLELEGDRIAWSFPDLGVTVSPFVAAGQIVANGKAYEIEHLYGIKPFPDEESMAAFRRQIDARVAWWQEQKTPYCDEQRTSGGLCVSCLGFVMRVLYPGASPALPAVPPDFRSAVKNLYTTEDLLMYLAGVRLDAGRQARLKRIQAIRVPDALREELVRISEASAPVTRTVRAAVTKPRPAGRSIVQSAKRSLRRGS